MANYHLHVKTGSRKKSKSAAAKSDYITRQGKYSADSDEVLFSVSGNMPEWAVDQSVYWKSADTYERSNGRLYKEIEFSLPRELNLNQQIELVESFARHLTQGENLPFTLAVHSGGGGNPHCHLMINERINDGISRSPGIWFKRHDRKKPDRSGAKKTDKLKPKKWLHSVREDWASIANFALERGGFDERIDHRRLIDQGIDRAPQIHLGQATIALERKGIITGRGQEALEIQRINEEYERFKNLKREQEERTPDRTDEPRVSEVKKTERLVQEQRKRVVDTCKQARPQNGTVETSKSDFWSRGRDWLDSRFGNLRGRGQAQVLDSKPDVKLEVDLEAEEFFENLRKRGAMTTEQRALENYSEYKKKSAESDQQKIKNYEDDLARRPRSVAPARNLSGDREM